MPQEVKDTQAKGQGQSETDAGLSIFDLFILNERDCQVKEIDSKLLNQENSVVSRTDSQ